MQFGNEHESTAVIEWWKVTGNTSTQCGFSLNDTGILGATPDRLVGGTGLLEVKTFPKVAKSGMTIDEYISKCGHLLDCPLAKNDKQLYYLKSSHTHYQVQGQLSITHRTFCILLYWIPEQLIYFTVLYDKEWDELNIPKLTIFYKEEFLPRLLRHKNSL